MYRIFRFGINMHTDNMPGVVPINVSIIDQQLSLQACQHL